MINATRCSITTRLALKASFSRLITKSRPNLEAYTISSTGPFSHHCFTQQRREFSIRDTWLVNPNLKDHIRPSLTQEEMDDELESRDTGLSLCFLGTGAGKPTLHRWNPATALRINGEIFLFDGGEAVQIQFMKSNLKIGVISRIFVTHMHADHIFGLPGLLLSLQDVARVNGKGKRHSVRIYGPEGLYNYLAVSLSLSSAELRNITVDVYELRNGNTNHHPGTRKFYREFRHQGLFRKSIPKNEDGTWTIEECREILTPEDATRFDSRPQGMSIKAGEVDHVPKVCAFGYVLSEGTTQPRIIDREKAEGAGVKPGKKYKLLKSGFPVMNDDESRLVDPEEVLVGDRPKGRKVVIIGDCKAIPEPMARLCQDADVVVHEATLLTGHEGNRVDFGGHSTGAQAGKFADDVNAAVLLLNHISPSVHEDHGSLLDETRQSINGGTMVQIAYDFLELMIPRAGFEVPKK